MTKTIGAVLGLMLVTLLAHASPDGSCPSQTGSWPTPNAGLAVGFLKTTPSPGEACIQVHATCIDGNWIGPTLYPYCQAAQLDCDGVPNMGVIGGYTTPNGACIMTTVICLNGVPSGPMPFQSCLP
jgi:hypothetical protein